MKLDVEPFSTNKKKHQIILTHTGRVVGDYLTSLKKRLRGKSKKVPNYVISRDGVVYELMKPETHRAFFNDVDIDNTSIIISLENLGWLDKEPLKNSYINWIGNIYSGEVVQKKWRDYFIWQPYTTEQMNSLVELCEKLMKEFKIDKKFVGHNTKVPGVRKYCGIVTRSNFDSNFTDLSPAFDYELFAKLIEK
jgi:N-acetyl-anhydromuramyl-L-alanine amidase AmpD